MSMFNFNSTTNYSSLFSSLGSGAGSSNFLADYASIKNGSYGRLMKSYYGTVKASSSSSKSGTTNVVDKILEEKRNPKVSKDVQEANEKLVTGMSSLRTTVSALQSDKTYTDTANGSSAADKVVAGIKEYVTNYNDVVSASKDSTLTNKTAYVANMMSATAANADKLSEIGISIDSNGTLILDETKLKAAGTEKVQELFSKDIMSYGSTVASRLQFAGSSINTNSTTDSTGSSTTAASSAASLKADAKALASDKLFEFVKDKDGNDTGKYDIDNILATAKSFVKNYNNMFDKAESSTNSGVLANLSYIRETTARNADALKQFGINVNDKGRLTIDEDKFKNSDMSKVQSFFKDYGSSVSTNASLVDYYMTTQASANSGYTQAGTYNVQGSSLFTDFM